MEPAPLSPDAAEDLPPTPDFDSYPVPAAIAAAEIERDGRVLRLAWSDGRESRFHALWLRDNATDPAIHNLETRENRSGVTAIAPDPRMTGARVDEAGALAIRWAGEAAESRFHPGWLYAHDCERGGRADEAAVDPVVWDATLGEPPTFDGAAVLEDDGLLEAWLTAVASHGLARLTNVPAEPGMVARVARRIGPLRETNFGPLFDVKVRTGPGSNAYSALALTPHTDLPTREYQPGLQFLHCLANSAAGGRAIMVDGLRLAAHIRAADPAAYRSLTEIPWPASNRALDSDYRWNSPVIRLDEAGRAVELRVVPFLRAPLALPLDGMEEAYRSLRVFFEAARDPAFALTFDYRPGDLVAMDNRRLLHGREAYDPVAGERWLQGCYGEREELSSRLRILARKRRAALT